MKRLAFVTTCKGRLAHLQESAKALLEDPRIGKEWIWVVVDFACPQKSGEWLRQNYGERVEVVKIDPTEDGEDLPFNKPLALNSGAVRAMELGAEYVAFLDADTLVTKDFLDVLEKSLSLDRFLIVAPSVEKRDLTGFLAVSLRHFFRAGGYDIQFVGWGAEDLEMRVKLFLKADLAFREIPALATPIPHADALRTKFYAESDKDLSHQQNLNLLCTNIYRWTGKHPTEFYQGERGHAIRRLLGVEPFSMTGYLK